MRIETKILMRLGKLGRLQNMISVRSGPTGRKSSGSPTDFVIFESVIIWSKRSKSRSGKGDMGMSQVEVLRVALIGITFLCSLAFVITYHTVAKWWTSEFGRSLMVYQVAMTIILGLSALTSIFGRTDWIVAIGVAIFLMVPIALIWRTVILIKIQRQAKEGQDDR